MILPAPFARTCAFFVSSIVLSVATTLPSQARYRDKAEQAADYIQAHFYDAKEGLCRATYPQNPKGLPYDFSWGNGVQFTNLVAAAKYDPAKYKPVLYAFANGLRHYWDKDAPIPGFDAYFSEKNSDDKYYDDNMWFVLGFVEAYEVTKDKMFLDWARQTQKFALSGWDDKLGGGIYWFQDHKSKNTCSNAPAAAAAMRLYFVGKDKDQLTWAKKIRDWTKSHLQDADGLYWDNINLDGKIEKFKWTYNSALMVRANVLLYQATKDRQYLNDARRTADTGLAYWTIPATGLFKDPPRFTHLWSEALLRLYDATKDVRYLNAVRRHAAATYRLGRDTDGGYWSHPDRDTHSPTERKELIENAATARLFWLLAPYADVDELTRKGVALAAKGDDAGAEKLLRQAVDSDETALDARYRLWKVLTRLHRTEAADKEATLLREAAQDPASRTRLEALGWKG